MVKPTEYKLGETVKNNGTKDFKNMSEERLLSTNDAINRITENLSRNRLNKIVKMQNLSLNQLEKIERMNNLHEIPLNKWRYQDILKNTKICRGKIY